MEPMISVIVPVYNGERTLARCLNSLSRQSHRRLEVLVVDDGSTDGGPALCARRAAEDARFRLLRQPNGGVSSARNRGLAEAAGEFITFVDADDWVEPDYCAALLALCQRWNAQLAYCWETHRTTRADSGRILLWSGAAYTWPQKYAHQTCWGALYRRELLAGLRFREDLAVGEDSLFFAQAALRADTIVFQDRALYHYEYYPDSTANRAFSPQRYTELLAWREICQLVRDSPERYAQCQGAFAYRCGMMLRRYANDPLFRRRYRTPVLRAYRRSLRHLFRYYRTQRDYPALVKEALCGLFPDLWRVYHMARP